MGQPGGRTYREKCLNLTMQPETELMNEKIVELIDEFADLDPRERLELLADYAANFPELPSHLRDSADFDKHRIPECQTPVFLFVENQAGRIQLYAHVAPEAPTVMGFVGILIETFSGMTPEEVMQVPTNLVQKLGLMQALGMMRMQGLTSILTRIRMQVAESTS